VTTLIHCGDIGSADIPSLFRPWPTHYVLGNVDHASESLTRAIADAGHTLHGRFGELLLSGVRIAFLHGDDGRRFQETIESGEWDLVCYGHTHVADQRRVGKTLTLNPGALYRANPRSLAVVELEPLEATIVPLE
jgi:putative phosphoesterase